MGYVGPDVLDPDSFYLDPDPWATPPVGTVTALTITNDTGDDATCQMRASDFVTYTWGQGYTFAADWEITSPGTWHVGLRGYDSDGDLLAVPGFYWTSIESGDAVSPGAVGPPPDLTHTLQAGSVTAHLFVYAVLPAGGSLTLIDPHLYEFLLEPPGFTGWTVGAVRIG